MKIEAQHLACENIGKMLAVVIMQVIKIMPPPETVCVGGDTKKLKIIMNTLEKK